MSPTVSPTAASPEQSVTPALVNATLEPRLGWLRGDRDTAQVSLVTALHRPQGVCQRRDTLLAGLEPGHQVWGSGTIQREVDPGDANN